MTELPRSYRLRTGRKLLTIAFSTVLLLLLLHIPGTQAAPRRDSLETLLKERMDKGLVDATTIDVVSKLVAVYFDIDPAIAMEYARFSMQIADSSGNKNIRAQAYNQLGQIYRGQNLSELALEAYLKSLRLFEELKDTTAILYCYIDAGNIYYDKNAYDLAVRNYRKALNLAETTSDSFGIAVALNNLGLVSTTQNKLPQALNYFRQALQLRLLHKYDPSNVVQSYRYIGGVHIRLGNDDSVEYYFRSAIKLANELHEYADAGLAGFSLATHYLEQERYSEARKELKEVVRLFKLSDYKPHLPRCYSMLADISRHNGKLDKGLQYLDSALDISRKYDYLGAQEEVTRQLSSFYEAKGDARKALEYFKLSAAIRDSAFSQENLKKILQLQAQYEISRKEQALENSLNQTRLKEAELDQEKSKNTLLLVTSAFICLGGLAVFIAYHNKSNTNRKLRRKNEIIEDQSKDLEKAKELAESSLKAKSTFLSNMSHEIRTPMNAILGFTDLILLEKPEGKIKTYLNYIRETTGKLLVIINDILDISRIEAGKIKIENVDFNLHKLADELVHTVEMGIGAKDIRISTHIGPDVPASLHGDPTRLYQMLLNLMNNAVKFTEKGEVKLSVHLQEREAKRLRLKFDVLDTGIGIAADKLSSIFDSFEQADTSIQRYYGGTGLGLSITQKLAELMDGRLSVESAPGKGSVFSIHVWMEEAAQAVEAQEKQPEKEQEEHTISGGVKILYAEDNHLNRVFIQKLLAKWGIESDLAQNGLEAVELLRKEKYDLVLMDIQMPGLDGIEATRMVRNPASGAQNPQVKIIGLTADVFSETREKALEAGMDGLLLKPLKKEELLECLRTYLPAPL